MNSRRHLVINGKKVHVLPVDHRCPSMCSSYLWEMVTANDVITDMRHSAAESLLYASPPTIRIIVYKVIVVWSTYPSLLCRRYHLTKEEFRLLLEHRECTWRVEGF